MNKILIKHGSTFPTEDNLHNYELGIATINGRGIICSKIISNDSNDKPIEIVQTFGALCGEEPPEDFFSGVENIPNGTIYYHIRTRG